MTTTGLRRRPQYEEVLAAAHKDLSTQHGILSVGLQNFATRAINSPLFQRVQTGVEERMQGDQRRLLEEQGFQHDVQAMAVDAGVSAHDMNWVVANIQRPTPVPVPQTPPQTEARVDYLRVAAEMDLLAQRRATQAAHQQVADQAALQMSTLAVVTPAQQLVRAHHAAAPLPPPATPPPDTVSVQARSTGMSVRELVAARTRPRGTRTRSTPYGPSSSLAVPAGGFAASQTRSATTQVASAERGSRAAIEDARPATAPARAGGAVPPDTSSAAAWGIFAPPQTGTRASARPLADSQPAPLYAPSRTARAGVLSANVQAAARRHMLELARRHAQAPSARELVQGGKRKGRAPANTSILRRAPGEEHPKSKRRSDAPLDTRRYTQTYSLDVP